MAEIKGSALYSICYEAGMICSALMDGQKWVYKTVDKFTVTAKSGMMIWWSLALQAAYINASLLAPCLMLTSCFSQNQKKNLSLA